MRKRIFSLIVVLTLLLTVSVPAFALEDATSVRPSLTLNSGSASCQVTVRSAGADIEVTMELWSGVDLFDVWTGEGVGVVTVTGSCPIVNGYPYTLVVYGTADGVPFECDPVTKA